MTTLNFEPTEAAMDEEDNKIYEERCGGTIAAFICTAITLILSAIAFYLEYGGLGVFAAFIAIISVLMGLGLMPKK